MDGERWLVELQLRCRELLEGGELVEDGWST